MASWAELLRAEPDFARRVQELMTCRRHLTMATLRSDGAPRISGTEVSFEGGELRIGSMPGAVKALDLRRDPRVAIHGPTTDPPPGHDAGWAGEAKIAGRAVEEPSEGPGHRFRIDVQEAVITRLDERGERLVIESWSPDRGRRATTRA